MPTDLHKQSEALTRAIGRLEALADALELYAECELTHGPAGACPDFASGRHAALHLAASSIWDALHGRTPEAISSNYITAPKPHLADRSYQDLILADRKGK